MTAETRRRRAEAEAERQQFRVRLQAAADRLGVPVPSGDGYIPVADRVTQRLQVVASRRAG